MKNLASKSAQAVIVTGPQGCGKTLAADALRKHFGVHRVADEWWPGQAVEPDVLYLTSAAPRPVAGARWVEWGEVAHLAPVAADACHAG